MTAKLDTRVSPALDPETYRAVDGYNDDTRMFVDDVVNAFNDAYVTVGKVHDARAFANRNPTWNEDQKVLIVGKEAEKQKVRVLRRLDLAHRDLTARIAHTENELSQPLTEKAGLGSLNGEVRSFVRALNRSEREKFMAEALDSDDEPTLTALLGAQPFLSGLTPLDHQHYLRQYHIKKKPHLVTRLDLMKRFLDMLIRNGPVVHLAFEKAVGAKPMHVSMLENAHEQALAALKIEPA